MIYCFRKLRELRLLHIFLLHYSISLFIGGAAIAGLFVLGEGLQFYSVVVLCIMYTQPTFFILRRIKMYEIKQELRYGGYSMGEKIGLAVQASFMKPTIDKDFIINAIVVVLLIVMFFLYNELMIRTNASVLGIPLMMLNVPGMATILSIVKNLEEKK